MASKRVKSMENDFDKALIEKQAAKIAELESELEKYKKLLTQSVQVPTLDTSSLSPEKIIAETQLQRLKDASLERTLTLEETKKVEIFHKILNSKLFPMKKDDSLDMSAADSETLMRMLKDTN